MATIYEVSKYGDTIWCLKQHLVDVEKSIRECFNIPADGMIETGRMAYMECDDGGVEEKEAIEEWKFQYRELDLEDALDDEIENLANSPFIRDGFYPEANALVQAEWQHRQRRNAALASVMTATETGNEFNLSDVTVRQACERGWIPARKSSGTWLIWRPDAEERWRKK